MRILTTDFRGRISSFLGALGVLAVHILPVSADDPIRRWKFDIHLSSILSL